MVYSKKHNYLFIHIQKTGGSSISRVLYDHYKGKQLGNYHTRLQDIRVNGQAYKFAFVRNPWDRMVSWYNMMLKKGVHNSFSTYLLGNSSNFSEFLRCTEIVQEKAHEPWYFFWKHPYRKSIAFNQLDYLTDQSGNVNVDFVGRFENLQADFDQIMDNLKLPRYELPHLNKFAHDDYRKYYSDEDKEYVANLYKKDIDYFGYEF